MKTSKHKFRIYDSDGEDGQMVYSDKHNSKEYDVQYDFGFDEEGKVCCYWSGDHDDPCGYPAFNGGKVLDDIMQYIGISDMSEQPQELYEDDVIEVTIYSHSEPAKIVCQQRRKIEFKDGMFGIQWTKTDFLSLKHHFADSCSIIKIGNIWDNPELVNANE